ncbi:2-hydroxyacid dehydrogenase [Virgibacillus oceani]
MRPKIYITRKIPEKALIILEQQFDIEMWQEQETPVPYDILKKKVENIDGLFCLLTENIDKELLDHATKLKIVSNMAVGYNNIDVDAASEKEIMVTNTPGVLTETTADLTFGLLMATSRRLIEASNYLKEDLWKTWSPMQLTGQDIYGSTLGIVGLGRIGQAVAKRAQGFNMRVIYHNRTRKRGLEKDLQVEYVELDNLLKQSDFVCVLTPYTPNTHHLIGKEELKKMKETAILINTSRGGTIDESALQQALEKNWIWGAGLDVFENEPIDSNHPLVGLSNVVTLPHIGSASIATRTKMATLAADNLMKGLNGELPDYLVNNEVFHLK